jgi:ornithine lipid ester-linked acyl 2-hydroxylase
MYYDPALFPFTRILHENWRVVRAELEALDNHEFIDWPEHSLYGDRGWQTYGLYAFGQRQSAACARCPQTEGLVRQIPGLMMAGFSRLAPGTHIVPHIERDYLPTRSFGQRLLWHAWKLANPRLVREARRNVASDRYS